MTMLYQKYLVEYLNLLAHSLNILDEEFICQFLTIESKPVSSFCRSNPLSLDSLRDMPCLVTQSKDFYLKLICYIHYYLIKRKEFISIVMSNAEVDSIQASERKRCCFHDQFC